MKRLDTHVSNANTALEKTPKVFEAWFSLLDVYVHESTEDKGILLAFQKDVYEQDLHEVLDTMKADGHRYGEEG